MSSYSPSIAFVQKAGEAETSVVGAGIVIDRHRVLTCAHVVNAALGRDSGDIRVPELLVTLMIPIRDGGRDPFKARIIPEFWLPPSAMPTFGEPEDIALLELCDDETFPPDVTVARLINLDLRDAHDRAVWLTGIPANDVSDRIPGYIRGLTNEGRIQIDFKVGERVARGGFSGTAIWDERAGGAVGMLVARRKLTESIVGYGIHGRKLDDSIVGYGLPVEALVKFIPNLPICQSLDSKNQQEAQWIHETPNFTGRAVEIRYIKNSLFHNHVLPIIGPIGSGKSALIKTFLKHHFNDRTFLNRFPFPPSLLNVDISNYIGSSCVLRAINFSLDLQDSITRQMMNRDADDNEDDNDDDDTKNFPPHRRLRAELITDVLCTRFHTKSPLAFFEGWDEVNKQQKIIDDFIFVLKAKCFSYGAILIEGDFYPTDEIAKKRTFLPPLNCPPLDHAEAAVLASKYGLEKHLVTNLSKILSTLEVSDFGFPQVVISATALIRGRREHEVDEYRDEIIEDALLDAALPWTNEMLQKLGANFVVIEEGSFGPLAYLLFAAIFQHIPLLLFFNELSDGRTKTWLLMKQSGWITLPEEGGFLSESAKFRLRDVARRLLSCAEGDARGDELRSFIRSKLSETKNVPEGKRAMETALSWFYRTLPTDPIIPDLVEVLAPQVFDDPFPAFDEQFWEGDPQFGRPGIEKATAGAAMAQLSLAVRFEENPSIINSIFTNLINTLKVNRLVTADELKLLDYTAFLIGRRIPTEKENIIDIRDKIAKSFSEVKAASRTGGHLETVQFNSDISTLTWMASWLLNLADLRLDSGDDALQNYEGIYEKLISLIGLADVETSSMPPRLLNYHIDALWLNARYLDLRAKMATERLDRLAFLQAAVAVSKHILTLRKHDIRWGTFFIRRVRKTAAALADDNRRLNTIVDAVDTLRAHWGLDSTWHVSIQAQVSSLFRKEAARQVNATRRLELAELALQFGEGYRLEAERLAEDGDTRALLVFARTLRECGRALRLLGRNKESQGYFFDATELMRDLLGKNQSASAWYLHLKLLHETENRFGRISELPRWNDTSQDFPPEVNDAVRKCLQWLRSLQNKGTLEGRLWLWCVVTRWRKRGSLQRSISSRLETPADWGRLPVDKKLEFLEREYQQRNRNLFQIENSCGHVREVQINRIRLEAQYQRTKSIVKRMENVESTSIERLLQECSSRFPNDPTVILHHAEYHRYIWDFSAAADGFREAIRRFADGDSKRSAMLSLAETLLLIATFENESGSGDDAFNIKDTLLDEASDLIENLKDFGDVAFVAALLSDQIKYERGQDISWDALDHSFASVVGDNNRFFETVCANIELLLEDNFDLPESLADAVIQEFTNIDALLRMGSLYLRRAERTEGELSVDSAWRAYAAFGAAEALERSWYRSSRPASMFGMGKALIEAARKAGNPMPFALHQAGNFNALERARFLMNAVLSNSVGRFRREVRVSIRQIRFAEQECGHLG